MLNVPRELWTIDGVCLTRDLLEEEVLAVTKVKIVVLPVKVKPGFRLFDLGPVKGVEEKVAVI